MNIESRVVDTVKFREDQLEVETSRQLREKYWDGSFMRVSTQFAAVFISFEELDQLKAWADELRSRTI